MAMPTKRLRRAVPGFTLVELMVVIAVAAILAAVAAPSLSTFVKAQRLRNAAFDIVSDLMLARSEALNRHATVLVSPTTTNGDGWSGGWEVKAGTQVLTSRTGLESTLRFAAKDSSAASLSSLSIGADGRVVALTPVRITVTYTDPMPSGVTASCVIIDATGRPRSDKGACS